MGKQMRLTERNKEVGIMLSSLTTHKSIPAATGSQLASSTATAGHSVLMPTILRKVSECSWVEFSRKNALPELLAGVGRPKPLRRSARLAGPECPVARSAVYSKQVDSTGGEMDKIGGQRNERANAECPGVRHLRRRSSRPSHPLSLQQFWRAKQSKFFFSAGGTI